MKKKNYIYNTFSTIEMRPRERERERIVMKQHRLYKYMHIYEFACMAESKMDCSLFDV